MEGFNAARRFLLASAAANLVWQRLARAAGPDWTQFRWSVCNEMFEKTPFAESCRLARKSGYTGLEIAPFTLGETVDEVTPARRRELVRTMNGEGIAFAGLHWLLVAPKWLHVTTADVDVRLRSWDYLRKLADLSGDLGGGVMVLGSPKQRGSRGNSRVDATRNLIDGLAAIAPHVAGCGSTLCLEALGSRVTDVVNTMAEVAAVVREVDHPGVQAMFDVHNVPDETDEGHVLVRRYYPMIRHVHINEMDGRHPGTGTHDFFPLLRTLAERKFSGWLSLEVFDFKPGAERIARESMATLVKVERQL